MGLFWNDGSRKHGAVVTPVRERGISKSDNNPKSICPIPHADKSLHDDGDDGAPENNNDDDNAPLLQQNDDKSEREATNATPLADASCANDAKTAEPSTPTGSKRYLGIAYILLATISFSVMTGCVKYSTRYISSPEIVFWRATISWILNLGVVRWQRVNLRVQPAYRRILLFRCCIGSMCISLHFFAMTMMSVTDSIVILFTSPVITFLLGAWILKEPIERIEFSCALCSYIGVLFVAKPAFLFPHASQDNQLPLIGVLAALGAAFAQSCAVIAIRMLKPVNSVAITHYFGLVNIGLALVTMMVFQIPFILPTAWNVQLALFLSGVSSCLGMLWLTMGFQLEKAGIASSLRYIDVVLAFIIDCAILGQPTDNDSLLGGCIILAGAAVIAVRRIRSKK